MRHKAFSATLALPFLIGLISACQSKVTTVDDLPTQSPVSADTVAPSITAFTIPASSNSTVVTGIVLTASDAAGVTGYYVSEVAATPSPTINGWSVSPPTNYTFAGISSGAPEARTLYAWVKDAAGNVSSSLSASIVIFVPTLPIFGQGSTTISCVDKDGDGYGVGPTCAGVDADDEDAAVHSGDQAIAKWSSLGAFLAHRGYNPLRIWQISTSGNDTTCLPNDASKPCLTYGKVHQNLTAGDMVLYRAGTYTETIYGSAPHVSGTEDRPIVFLAYPGERVTIRSTNPIDFSPPTPEISFGWVTIDGFEITSPTNAGEVHGGNLTGFKLINNDIHHVGRGIHTGSEQFQLRIEGNVIHDIDPNYTMDGHCIYLSGYTSTSTDITVRGNILFNCSYNAFQFNGPVTNLVFENNIGYGAGLSCISLLEGVKDSYFRNNVCFNNARSGVVLYDYDGTCGVDGIGCPRPMTGNIFENNTFWVGRYHPKTGIDISNQSAVSMNDDSATAPHSFGYNVFRNNIMVTQIAPAIKLAWPRDLETMIFENNIFYRADGNATVLQYGSTAHGPQTNYTVAQLETLFSAALNKTSSPSLTATNLSWWAASQNFDLKPGLGSPAFQAGTATGAPATDIRGILRGLVPTIGAYE